MENAIVDLVDFGLTPLQSKAYIALLRLGTCRASEISLAIGVARPEAYRVLREISSKGLALRNPGSPSTYTAVAPKEGLSRLLNRFSMQLASLEHKRKNLEKFLGSQSPHVQHAIQGKFSIVAGGDNLTFKVNQMIRDAEHEYVAIVSKYGLRRTKETGLARAYVSAKRRNLSIRLISEIENSNAEIANWLSRYAEIRHSPGILLYMGICDKREMILGPAVLDEELKRPNRTEVDLWTDDSVFVRGVYGLFEHLWRASSTYRPSR